MSLARILRHAAAATCLLALGNVAYGAQIYKLHDITVQTGNAAGIFPFGVGALAASLCDTCNVSLVTDDGLGNLTLASVSYRLTGFGANFRQVFQGTTTLGAGGVLDKSSDTCTVFNTATQYCAPSAGEARSYEGDWYTGFRGDGTTASNAARFDAILTGSNLQLSVRKALRADDPLGSASWLQLNFNYVAIPVPGAVWLLGGAIGLLAALRRRTLG